MLQVLAGFAVLISVTVAVWATIAFGWLGLDYLTGWGGEYTALAVASLYAGHRAGCRTGNHRMVCAKTGA